MPTGVLSLLRRLRDGVLVMLCVWGSATAQPYCDARLTIVSTATQRAMSPSADQSNKETYSTVFSQINQVRNSYDATPLAWNVSLSTLAELQACNDTAGTSLTSRYARNTCPSSTNVEQRADWVQCINAWFAQSIGFVADQPDASGTRNDFINIVWDSSTQVGCGSQVCSTGWHGLCFFDAGLPSPASIRASIPDNN